MIKRITTTAILLMVVAAVGLALLVTPAESASTTSPPYRAGDRWAPAGVDTRHCNKVVGAQDGVPDGYLQTVYVLCKNGGSLSLQVWYVNLDGTVVLR